MSGSEKLKDKVRMLFSNSTNATAFINAEHGLDFLFFESEATTPPEVVSAMVMRSLETIPEIIVDKVL